MRGFGPMALTFALLVEVTACDAVLGIQIFPAAGDAEATADAAPDSPVVAEDTSIEAGNAPPDDGHTLGVDAAAEAGPDIGDATTH
jgi:hypothetical protein